jgi:N6-adenosine-specific RNA methylase IME4
MMRQRLLWEDGPFSATDDRLRVKGKPTLQTWSAALRRIAQTKTGLQWALGDLLAYAETRQWDEAEIEMALDATNLKRGTLLNLRTIAKKFPPDRRRPVPWSHHALAASLANDDQDHLLQQAIDERWGWDEMRAHCKAVKQAAQRDASVFPTGRYGVILTTLPKGLAALKALKWPLAGLMAPSCLLYVVVPSPHLLDAFSVAAAWGFAPRTFHVLLSDLTLRRTDWMIERHVVALLATRGPVVPPDEDRLPDSILTISSTDPGSEPAQLLPVQQMIEQTYPDLPKLHLFTETPRDGWTGWTGHDPVVAAHSQDAEAVVA